MWMILLEIFQVFSLTTPAHHLALCTDATALLGEHCNVEKLKGKCNDLAFSDLL